MRPTILLLLALFIAAPAMAGDGVVIAGVGGQPPFSRAGADGTLQGLEPELAQMLCNRLPQPCVVVAASSWDDLIAGLREGRYAVGFGGLSTVTLDRLGIATSEPYLPVLAERAEIASLAGATDPLESSTAIIGVMRGTPHALWLEERLPVERLRRFADDEELFLSLHTGTVDAVFGDGLALWRDLLGSPLGQGVALRGPGIAVEDDGIVLALGDPAQSDAAAAALSALIADGTVDTLIERYLPGLPRP